MWIRTQNHLVCLPADFPAGAGGVSGAGAGGGMESFALIPRRMYPRTQRAMKQQAGISANGQRYIGQRQEVGGKSVLAPAK